MRYVLTMFVLLLAFASASPMPQHGNDRQKRKALVVPREIVLPAVAFQPDCPLTFETAETVHWLGNEGGASHRYVLRNNGLKPVVALKVAAITQLGTGT